MKNFLILMLGILLAQPSIYSKTVPNRTEKFDGTVTPSTRPSVSLEANRTYHLSGTSITTAAPVYSSAADNTSLSDIDNNNSYVSPNMDATTQTESIILSGIKTIGLGGDYATISAAISDITNYGLANNLTLLLHGTFPENVDLTNLSSYQNGYTLTITSYNGNPDNAVINPSTGVGITLANTRDIVLKDITVNVTNETPSPSTTNLRYAIRFTNACTNIVVRGCKLLANPASSNSYSALVYKTTNTGIVDSIFFINNTLDGGYYGFFFYGGTGTGTGQYGTHVVFDSNIVSNQYYYGAYHYYTDITSCSHNTILSRASGTINTNTWWGLVMNNSNGPVISNRIIQRSNTISSPIGINLNYYNYYLTTQERSPVINNEIILNTTATSVSSYSGIYATNTKADILHNSIYISGTGMAGGISISYSATANNLVIKNNNIVTTSPTVYPIYFSGTGALTNYNIDSNNYYAPSCIGYYGAAIVTMEQWRQRIPADLHSVSVLPDFVNTPTNSLQMKRNWQLLGNRISSVMTDINGNSRNALTTFGCYEALSSENRNAMLGEITGLREGNIAGQTDAVKVKVYNTGSTTLTSINLEWSVNGVSQKTGGDSYALSLSEGDFTTITLLGNITYTSGTSEIRIWINDVNGAGFDDNRDDNLSSKSIFVCSGVVGSSVTIGSSLSSDYKTFQQMWKDLQLCGASGDLTVAFEPGTYTENVDLSDKTLYLSDYALTITSTTHDAKDVSIRPVSGVGVMFGNSRNITLKDITVDATVSKSNAIQFTAACTNITVRDCQLLTDPTATSNQCNAVYKPTSTGMVDSVFFINNTLDGGYYGFYFYGGTGNTAYGNHVVFDSNIVSNQYQYAVYPYYADFTSCSHNTILSRASNTMSQWYGLYMNYVNGPVIGNRIIQRSAAITSPYGIYLSNYNYYPSASAPDTSLIANNEIILTTTTNAGIYVNTYTRAKILHNSIYISGTAAARGIYVTKSTGCNNYLVIKNNNIALTTTSTTAYPVYISTATGNLSLDINYNNYYVSHNNIGYHGAAMTMTQWKTAFPSDTNSVQILPTFINATSNLELSAYPSSLSCPALTDIQGVENDIRGVSRAATTYMGAYTETTVSGCPTLSGIKTVGLGGDFMTLAAAIKAIQDCGGLADNLTLQLNGYFAENVDLTNFSSSYQNGYTLTITSYKENPANAIISPSTGVGITFSNTRDIVLKDITVDVRNENPAASTTNLRYAIRFTGACTNIVVRGCKLLANPTTYSSYSALVYKPTNAGIVDSIFFIDNTLDGGYYGFYFYGGTGNTAYGTNVVFDSNIVSNQYYQNQTYFYYTDLISCSYNTILSKASGSMASQWCGLYMYYVNGTIIGNRIIQRFNPNYSSYMTPSGIYLNYYNTYPTASAHDTSLVTNNEIILNTSTTNTNPYYGIYASTARAKILHNSIYISGTGAARGININNSTSNYIVIKNNNIVTTPPDAYPIYFSSAGNLPLYDIDYNNYYAPNYIGYNGINITTMEQWRQQRPGDLHSVSVLPDFINTPASSLQVKNNWQLLGNRISLVMTDINGNPRNALSALGCYEVPTENRNAMLAEITGLREGNIAGQTDAVKVKVYNTGTTPLTSINLEWSVNGVSQNTGGDNYVLSLAAGDTTTITLLENITYPSGTPEIKIWINDVNGAGLDDNRDDDISSKSILVCSGVGSSVTIGSSGSSDYKTFQQMWNVLQICGANEDLTVAFEPGTYTEGIDLSDKILYLSDYALTITSTTHNANDVSIRPASGVGIIFGNSRNITLKDITIDATVSRNHAIQFTAACTNIAVRDCRLLAYIGSTYYPVYKAPNTGVVDSVFFINNTLDGGTNGFLFAGGTGTGIDQYGTHVVFDSNIVSNQNYYGINSSYVDFTSCSYNTILSNTSGTFSWSGIRMNNVNGHVIGNRIIQRDNANIAPYGIYLTNYNYYPTASAPDTSLVANNEIILTTTTNAGIYVTTNTRAKILHNSIYISGTAAAKGIYVTKTASCNNYLVIKNNNIVLTTTSATAYPVYITSATGNLFLDINYNNYYVSHNNIGYHGAAMTMTQWQTDFPSDINSVQILPTFIDATANLELSAYSSTLSCPAITDIQGIENDKRGVPRSASTYMGAYTELPVDMNKDLELLSISNPVSLADTIGKIVQLSLNIRNNASYTSFTDVNLTAIVKNSQGDTTVILTGTTISSIGMLSTSTCTFPQFYIPSDSVYYLTFYINDNTDANPTNDTITVKRTIIYVGKDLELLSIINPTIEIDTIGSSVTISLSIQNNSGYTSFTGKTITLQIKDSQGTLLESPITEMLPTIVPSATLTYTFTQSYTVPNVSAYSLFVYIDSADINSLNDTVSANRTAIDVGKDLQLLSITYPSAVTDTIGNPVNVSVSIKNNSSYTTFTGRTITLVVKDVQGTQIGNAITEALPTIGTLATPTYTFTQSYTVPNVSAYSLFVYIDSADINSVNDTISPSRTAIDIGKDLQLVSITYPSASTDTIGNPVNVSVSIQNNSSYTTFNGRTITLVVKDSQGTPIGSSITETLPTINTLATPTYTFTQSYIVPNVSAYSLLVYLDSADINSANDTISPSRTAIDVGKDLQLLSLTYPSAITDTIGNAVNVSVSIQNNSSYTTFNGRTITLVVKDSQGTPIGSSIIETLPTIVPLATPTYTFTQSYIVPNVSAYSLLVYLDNADINSLNDTISPSRTAIDVGKDLQLVSLTYPSAVTDTIGNSVNVSVSIQNNSSYTSFTGRTITLVVKDSQGTPIGSSITETLPTIVPLATPTYTFTQSYTVPNVSAYSLLVYLDNADINSLNDTVSANRTAIDIGKDLQLVSLTYPSAITDTIGNPVNVSVSIKNNSSYTTFTGRTITLVVKDALGTPIGSAITETLPTIVPLATPTYTFTQSYTVPNVSAYSLFVYIDSADINSLNDTVSANRTATDIGKDLQLVSLTYPSAITDTIGNPVNVSVSIKNNSSYTTFTGRIITLVVKDALGTQIGNAITESLSAILPLATPTYTFTQSYTVPNVSAYSLFVYIDSADINSLNDTVSANRTATDIGKDLQLVSLTYPSAITDTIGNPVNVSVSIQNNSSYTSFTGRTITLVVKDSQGTPIGSSIIETLPTINTLATPTYTFTQVYTVPNDLSYSLLVYIDSADINSVNDTISANRTTTDIGKDLQLISIINSFYGVVDTIGSVVDVMATVGNISRFTTFTGVNITVVVKSSQGQQLDAFTETIPSIGISDTVTYPFTQSYTIPNDSVYYLTVYIDSYDNDSGNDTINILRQTTSGRVGIFSMEGIKGFSLAQNIPNPVSGRSTRIDYSVPEAGDVMFHVHSISGQLLYSKTIKASCGANSIELNASTFATGIYVYSMEYKGQILVKQLIINSTN